MSEIKIFVQVNEGTSNKVVICQENANKLGLSKGASVEVENPNNNKKATATIEISNMVLDFAGQVSKNVVDELEFDGIELIIRPFNNKGFNDDKTRPDNGDYRFPYPYVYRPPEPPDDIEPAYHAQKKPIKEEIDPQVQLDCPYCGYKIPKEQKYCPICGKDVF
ncbi:MAG: zinc ribbon domain-containing protein [Candidatus Hodarchaeota archaeon]